MTWFDNVKLGEKHTSLDVSVSLLQVMFLYLYCSGYSHWHFARLFPLTDSCIHLIPVYTIKLGLRIFLMPDFYCMQLIVRYSVYFKIRWPSESLMMNLLMRFFWKMKAWFSRTRVSVVFMFNGFNCFYCRQLKSLKTKLSTFKFCNDLLNSFCRKRYYFVQSCFFLNFLAYFSWV